MDQYRLTLRGKLIVFLLVVLIVFGIVIGLRGILGSFNDDIVSLTTEDSSLEIKSSLVSLPTEITVTKNDQTSLNSTSSTNNTDAKLSDHQETTQEVNPIINSEDERILLNASKFIVFEQDKSELSETMKIAIREFYRTARAYKGHDVVVKGISLKLIDLEKSKANALSRAKAVANYLIDLGMNPNKIKIETKIANYNDYESTQLSKAIAAELYFYGYQKEVK